ncbi:MAG: sulfatase-like hydrolase/transferase [Actinomycetota bacterium]
MGSVLVVASVVVGVRATPSVRAADRPSIVLILTDDQRWDQVAAMPILQSELIGRGTTFTNGFVVNPLCCPTRTTILTGRYSHSTGVYRNGGPHGGFGAFDDSSTLATWLSDAGYRTGLIGKYLNGYLDPSYIPPGWDRWVAFSDGSDYVNYELSVDGSPAVHGSDAADYSTDVLADEAVGFIEATPPEQPLFLEYTPFAPHAGWIPPERYVGALGDLPTIRPPNLNEADVSDKPAWVGHLPYSPGSTYDQQRRRQAQTLLAVDDAIGRILAALDATGRTSETLIIFTSDNGLSAGSHRWGSKSTPWDEAIRVPLVIRYDPSGGPTTQDAFALDVDLAPTIAEVAGIGAPGAEGTSLLPLLGHDPADPDDLGWRDAFLIEYYAPGVPADAPPTYCAVRTHTQKYIRYTTGEEELYDLVQDPFELQSLHADGAFAAVKASLLARLRDLCSPPPPDYSFTGSGVGTLTPPTDLAIDSGLWDGAAIRSYGAYPLDYDADGWQDVLLVPHVTASARLMHNEGGTFTRQSVTTFPRRDRHGCDAADVDLDGLVDIYCAVGADSGTGTKANELWMQTEPGVFEDMATVWGVADPYGRGREVTFLDVDHDAYPDLYVTNAYPRADGIASPNRLYVNVGGSGFRAAGEFGLDVEVGGILGTQTCVQAVDVDVDGWEDLLVCGKAGLKMYLHDGQGFTDRRAALKMPTGIHFDARLADMNGDGSLDLVALGKTKLNVYLRGATTFGAAAFTLSVASPRQVEVADLDADGDLDIYVVTGASSGTNLGDLILENDGTGRLFRTVPALPATGEGQSVASIDHDGNGVFDLIVLNGFKTVAGPVQLLAFQDA